MGLYEVDNLNYYYPEKDLPSLVNIKLSIEEGEFIFLIGPSGGGKSSLLRALAGLLPDYYGGKIGGEVLYDNCPLARWDKRRLAREIGMIFQDPERQLVMTVVEQEIAFGLENLGIPLREMRRRVAEVLSLFDLSSFKGESTFNLSGGQKQKVVLASISAMYPRVLLLDEPTSQLDPVAAQEFLNYIYRLNIEWGLTVVLVEQRVDRCFHLADRVVLMDKGKVVCSSSPRELVQKAGGNYKYFIPPVTRVFYNSNFLEAPLTIKEGRKILKEQVGIQKDEPVEPWTVSPAHVSAGNSKNKVPVLETKNLCFAYPKKEKCLKGLSLKLYPGEITAVLGENGSGKSTLLKNLNGLLKPQQGKILLNQKDITCSRAEQLSAYIGYLSQNPNDYLFNETVFEEISFNLKARGRDNKRWVEQLIDLLKLAHLKEVNPRDLSGGERQRVALGTVLAVNPPVLLLDEPTRGLDAELKHELGLILNVLRDQGKSILVVTHDIEFAAELSQRVLIISDGEIAAEGDKAEILSNSLYYASQVNKLFRGICPSILTVEEAVQYLKMYRNNGKKDEMQRM